ncbi:tRNA (adenosine(37)-N6)-threonylcarbamoyltransferase complex ATPase subunit type 1 TsaE [Trueperella pecoris]|uniref:tRNA threonylcarbamoyladenosine biosynthesis protein TsaE n=1 Tax=Trueperella pecoris TaxID=2733571 RepID=A0A7M1QT73_9ACTO|nr:tRNA (adenosine(37)-N6)-threonylcarbamoyltransferase complex ATPase subunit type 1 TsaE [Trueperella pecoris]QOR45098.1 tRNA (adenosine(37)-N6)-threonylcarbamoyltransferase complex ATPase subunit type 1 TsaE [Trueperella pecoris]QTG75006.1 tRNA (adenosine(37)-N6)-threonylcarbamoyltransferase complex ATPase subunit type 1 TsaE [Trueperella pecoris]
MKLVVPTVEAIHRVGRALGELAQPGDLIMLNGPLGAGKTTMTQGIAAGLGVADHVSSPTFVIAQIHPGRIDLVHVDAYRLTSMEELDALDLDASLEESVTVVEWGSGKVESLTGSRLEIDIERPTGGNSDIAPEDLGGDEPRTLTLRPTGERGAVLADALLADVGDLASATE